jgi:D-3-phosphoglycerate dehydrogenase
VGTEHIDLVYAAQKGVAVFTSPEGSRDTVAEHALGMLLMLMNKLGKADREVRAGKWLREPNRGVEIKGKTVGILGYGNMGQAFARRLVGLACAEVIAYDKFRTNYGDDYARSVGLDELQERSDILSIHIPYLPENHHFIDGPFLDRFARDIYLINTARGTVLNTAHLVERMKSGRVLGAALDVLEYEEMSFSQLDLSSLPEPFQYLRRSDQAVLSPHIAGWSFESKAGHARVLADKIAHFLRQEVPG